MRALIDTNVLVWWLYDHPRLAPYRRLIEDPRNDILFSSISVTEVSLKASTGKLVMPNGYVEQLKESGIRELEFTSAHGLAIATLPWHHKDPFDRMIIAQALSEGLPVVTADPIFSSYGLQVVG